MVLREAPGPVPFEGDLVAVAARIPIILPSCGFGCGGLVVVVTVIVFLMLLLLLLFSWEIAQEPVHIRPLCRTKPGVPIDPKGLIPCPSFLCEGIWIVHEFRGFGSVEDS